MIPDNLLLGMSFEETNLHPSIGSFVPFSDNYTLERTTTEKKIMISPIGSQESLTLKKEQR